MYRLFEKIKQCRHALVDWSRVTFGNLKNKNQRIASNSQGAFFNEKG